MSLRDHAPRKLLDGFGRAVIAECRCEQPSDLTSLVRLLEQAKHEGLTVTFRGGGRSYGDAALNTRGIVIDTTSLNRILSWDPATGLLTAEAGVTIEQLWHHVIADGFWPAVVPGTMYATLGGCVAMNVHGKNNPRQGTFGEHVVQLELLTADGKLVICSREQRPELFFAVVGGLGLLGAVVHVTLRLRPVHSGRLRVKAVTASNLQETLAQFDSLLPRSEYVVGWVDAFAQGNDLGRSEIHAATEQEPGEEPACDRALSVDAQRLPNSLFGVPYEQLWRLMRPFANPLGVSLVNAIKFRLARLTEGHSFLQSRAAFEFLLDYVPDWRLIYGDGGFIQHQLFVPHGMGQPCLERVLRACQEQGVIPYLAVLKRHREDDFLLSHSLDGWSLALDFRVKASQRDEVWQLTNHLTELVLGAGGTFYFAKDAVLKPAQVTAAYGEQRIAQFLSLKQDLDPSGLFGSNLAERVFSSPNAPF